MPLYNKFPIIIIGAGISGLSCARQLMQAGQQVLILEARMRKGGRIHSVQHYGHTFDLGASWIHGIKDNPIWSLSQQHKIQTEIFNYDYSYYYHDDGRCFSAIESNYFEECIAHIENKLIENKEFSAYDALNKILEDMHFDVSIFPQQELKKLLLAFFERLAADPFATRLSQLSPHFSNFEGYFAGDEVIFPQGYAQIIEKIAENIPIKYDIEIKNISQLSDHVRLIDQNNCEYQASKVVVTIPLGLLKTNKISFNPVLPVDYIHAIHHIGFGSFNKVFLEFEQPIDFSNEQSVQYCSHFFSFNNEMFNILDLSKIYYKPIYLLLFGGTTSEWIDHASDAEVKNKILTAIQHNFPNKNNFLKHIEVTRWGTERFSGGAFSFPLPQHCNALIQKLNQPIDKIIFFSGEHCSLNYSGTVHGAYLSGMETANKIISTISTS